VGATAKNPLNLIRVMPAKGQECFALPARPETSPAIALWHRGARHADAPKEPVMQPVVFIARLVGPLFVVLGVGTLLNQTLYADMIGQAILVPVLIYLSGLMAFTAGVAILNGHHAWTADWRVLITIIGWILVIAGIVRIVLPAITAVAAITLYSGPPTMAITGVIVLVLGGFLSFQGYRRQQKL
jgi:small-conductance mechanosensitive channel